MLENKMDFTNSKHQASQTLQRSNHLILLILVRREFVLTITDLDIWHLGLLDSASFFFSRFKC